MCWREASLLKWRVVNPRQFTPAESFTSRLQISTSGVATRVRRNPQRFSSSLSRRWGRRRPLECREMAAPRWTGLATFGSVFLRLALGISFLSAVADRFGLWGVYGQPNVGWGNYARFVDYTAKLTWFLPAATIPALAIIATAAEILFGLLLVLGWKTRTIALLSGVLLTTFALAMTMALGVKSSLDLSVFSVAGGALLLATY